MATKDCRWVALGVEEVEEVLLEEVLVEVVDVCVVVVEECLVVVVDFCCAGLAVTRAAKPSAIREVIFMLSLKCELEGASVEENAGGCGRGKQPISQRPQSTLYLLDRRRIEKPT